MNSTVLLVIAGILAVISLVMIAIGSRSRPKSSVSSLWPLTFFHPLASDNGLLTPRKTQTGSHSMPTTEFRAPAAPTITSSPAATDDEETARKISLAEAAKAAESTNPNKVDGDAASGTATDEAEPTNRVRIDPAASTPDPDATNRQKLQ
jgi:hypothetical protein